MSNSHQMSANNYLPISITNPQLQLTNSSFIKSEIERFESVHPSIYSIYELIDDIKDQLNLQPQIREHVMIIEGESHCFRSLSRTFSSFLDSFVNSQEWTLSRSVLDIRIGLLGTLSSGKSALVHRFLTGTYMQEDSPEGGRFKKEITIDNQSYLLLIRDEGTAPDTQVDCIIFIQLYFVSIRSYFLVHSLGRCRHLCFQFGKRRKFQNNLSILHENESLSKSQ